MTAPQFDWVLDHQPNRVTPPDAGRMLRLCNTTSTAEGDGELRHLLRLLARR